MNRYGLALLVLLVPAGIALADAYVELVPSPPGPYAGGETVHIDLSMWQDTGEDVELRLIEFAFVDTDPSLDVTDFEFDFSSLVDSELYFDGSLLDWWPYPDTAYCGMEPVEGFMLTLPADGSSLRLAQFEVLLPPTIAGPLVLDVMNYDEPDPDFGARLRWGFPPNDLRAYDGVLHGGVLDFVSNPEPGALTLMFVGASCISLRRRCR